MHNASKLDKVAIACLGFVLDHIRESLGASYRQYE
jgi:hypothetical protein